jgi:hypothetical protein
MNSDEYRFNDDRSEILGKLFSLVPDVLSDQADQAAYMNRERNLHFATLTLTVNFLYQVRLFRRMYREPMNRNVIFKRSILLHSFSSTYFIASLYRQWQFEK